MVLPAGVVVAFVGLGRRVQRPWSRAGGGMATLLLLCALAGFGFSLVANPYRLEPVRGAVTVAILLPCLVAFWLIAQHAPTAFRARALGLAAAIALVAVTSGLAGVMWIWDGGLHVEDDRALTERSRNLARLIDQDAVVATVWAGSPGYQMRRRMIDLLGKSDREIARGPPVQVPDPSWFAASFFPGHNKWDYEQSIGLPRPDVVLALWWRDEEVERRMASWGYVHRCFYDEQGAWFRSSSSRIDWAALWECESW